MEIIPGMGLPVAKVGQTQADIEAIAGLAVDVTLDPDRAFWHSHKPAFAATFAADGLAEFIEVFCSQGGSEQATLNGVQLTFRLLDDVVADLERHGLHGRRMDIGVLYEAGFFLWSMSSLSPSDLTGGPYNPDDARMVVEGVGLAPIDYWADVI